MTYDDYRKDILNEPGYAPPPPPMPSPMPTFGQRMTGMRNSVARNIANAVTTLPFDTGDLGGSVHNFMRSIMEGRPKGLPQLGEPLPGEKLALQMPGFPRARDFLPNYGPSSAFPQWGSRSEFLTPRPPSAPLPPRPNIAKDLRRLRDWLMKNSVTPPGFRDMPRYGGSRYESNTRYIPAPPQPESTPYPVPPMLSFRNWMDTGERGPRPLDARRPGNYPAPYSTPLPEAYETRTSGGMLG
jgi:hypothetical protein